MTRVGIMQPYFFPYLGYFSLIKNVDRFILLDTVQFIRHGWVDRNRILKQGQGWLYIRPAVASHSHQTPITEIRLDNSQPWQRKLLAQMESYRKVAPFYRPVRELVEQVLATPHDRLVSLNKAALETVCAYLGIDREIELFSAMGLDIEEPQAPDEWALNICKALPHVAEYWNPPGGRGFFDAAKYEASGIRLRFHEVRLTAYDQKRAGFEPGLSILDAMMFNTPETIRAMLDDFEVD